MEAGQHTETADPPSNPIVVASDVRACVGDDQPFGCRSNPAPMGSTFEISGSDLRIAYRESTTDIQPNPDYGSPLAARFRADFEFENTGITAISISEVVREIIVFDIDDRNRDLDWEAPGGSGEVGPGETAEVIVRYGLATRGWDLAEPWGIALINPRGGFVVLETAAIELGEASDSYADGGVAVAESASSDSPEAVVEAFHEAIRAWDIEAMCAQLSSQAQVQFTGRLVGGDCAGVVREIMGDQWQNDTRERFENPEIFEFWTDGGEVPEAETIIVSEPNDDGIYAVVKPSAGPWDFIFYDFIVGEGGVKIDVFLPQRVI